VPAVHQTIALAITQIQEVLKCTAFFNEQMLVLTEGRASLIKSDLPDLTGAIGYAIGHTNNYTFFRFDQKKWEEILKQISNKIDHPARRCRAADLAEECQLDLIEALAEYNIDSTLLEKALSGAVIDYRGDRKRFKKESSTTLEQLEMDRFIHNIKLPLVDIPESKFTKQLQDILTQAKNTLKGNIRGEAEMLMRGVYTVVQSLLNEYLNCPFLQGQNVTTILRNNRIYLFGPHIWPVNVWNLEGDWKSGNYGRFPNAAAITFIHLDYILKKASGRIVFKCEGQQIILRSINLPEGQEILNIIDQALVELPKVALGRDINKAETQEVEQMLKAYKEKVAKTYKIKL
jgi:hypothetical protein